MRPFLRLSTFSLALLFLLACRQQNATTPEAALHTWPGYLNAENQDSLEVLARQEMPLGVVLLYRYRSAHGETEGQSCLATTFVSGNSADGWRAQSSGGANCRPAQEIADSTFIRLTGGGNITGLTTVYGLAPGAKSVRITWGDGQVTTAAVVEGAILASRAKTVGAREVTVLDGTGNPLHLEDFCGEEC